MRRGRLIPDRRSGQDIDQFKKLLKEAAMAKGMQRKSIKDSGGIQKRAVIDSGANLGKLILQYKDVDEILYPYVTNSDLVYEEMDFTIEEFAEITGADVEDLINDIQRVIRKS